MSNPPEPPSAFAAAGPTPLEYVQPGADGGRRPGIVQALGIVSIVLACLQGLIALLTVASTILMMTMLSRMPAAAMPTTVSATTTTTTSSASFSVYSSGGTTSTSATMPAMFNALFAPSALRWASAAFALGTFALSIWLLVAGIQTLRGKRSGRRHHLAWAVLKVIVETIAGVIAAELMIETLTAMNAAMVNGGTPGVATMSGGMMSVQAYTSAGIQWAFSLLYPIAVWIVLTRRSVRQYFATVA